MPLTYSGETAIYLFPCQILGHQIRRVQRTQNFLEGCSFSVLDILNPQCTYVNVPELARSLAVFLHLRRLIRTT